ncbi:penicillin-binding protein activator [Aerophototrophica crusticola]|uniref:Penicillin-binding protein activator n=2 Tax=Aerophototrophica crusticola TaxID=1709002 RepID=A0A858RBU8_9PROT|nr:penicillin-binding protein activator [Rhodospirillaceae bacterium B3]
MRGVAACMALAGLVACASPQTVPAPPPPPQPPPQAEVLPQVVAPPPRVVPNDGKTRIALLLPLTGRGANIGKSMLDAAQLAVFELAGDEFLLLPRDTRGTPEGAAAAAQAAMDEGAKLVLGPLFSNDATAIRPIAATANVPVLSFSSDWAIAGGGLWTLGFQPQDQVRRVVNHALAQGITRFGVLAPNTAYGQAVVDSLAQAAQAGGGQVTKVERYAANPSNPTDLVKRFAEFDRRRAALEAERARLRQAGDEPGLRRLANASTFGELPYQAVLLAEGGAKLKELASLLPFFDVDPGPVRVLGTGLWDEPGLGREPALLGGWYAAPAPESRQPFEARFQELYGYRPHRLATLAYDATALAAVLSKGGGREPFTPGALTNPNGFAGIDGIFRLLPNGLPERGLPVLEVTRAGVNVVDPAPASFEPRAF